MKSTVKVDFRSRYGDDNFGTKEPLIRVEVEPSDDPRDTLLQEIFWGDFVPIGASLTNPSSVGPNDRKTYRIYRKNRSEQLCELAGHVHTSLCAFADLPCVMITSNDEIYFEEEGNKFMKDGSSSAMGGRRSKGISRSEHEYDTSDFEFLKLITKDFKDFLNSIRPVAAPSPFFSRYQIGDPCSFTTPKAKDYAFEQAKKANPDVLDENIEYLPDYFWGKIVAVKFTEAKVWYDVLDDYSGKVFAEIPSHDVKTFSDEVAKQVVKQK